MILTPWELVRKNKMEIMQTLQEDGCILLAMGNMGRKGGYKRPFAALIQWPPSLSGTLEMDGVKVYLSRIP